MAIRFARRVRPLIALAALVGTAVAVAVAGLGHTAARSAPSAPVQKQLGQLALKNSQLVEKYDQAQVAVRQARQAGRAAPPTLARGRRARTTRARARRVRADHPGAVRERSPSARPAPCSTATAARNYLDRLDDAGHGLRRTPRRSSPNVGATRAQAAAAVDEGRPAAGRRQAAAARRARPSSATPSQQQIDKYQNLLATLTRPSRRLPAAANPSVASPGRRRCT